MQFRPQKAVHRLVSTASEQDVVERFDKRMDDEGPQLSSELRQVDEMVNINVSDFQIGQIVERGQVNSRIDGGMQKSLRMDSDCFYIGRQLEEVRIAGHALGGIDI